MLESHITREDKTNENKLFLEAFREIEAIVRKNKSNPEKYKLPFFDVLQFIGRATEHSDFTGDENTTKVCEKVFKFINEGNEKKGLDFVESLLMTRPNNTYFLLKSFLLLHMEKPSKALDYINDAKDQILDTLREPDPEPGEIINTEEHFENVYKRGKEYFLIGDYKKAEIDFAKASFLHMHHADLMYDRAVNFLHLREFNKAYEHFDKLIRVYPSSKRAAAGLKRTQLLMRLEERRKKAGIPLD